jgi:transcriptional regulator with XRE-family HTH domain
MDAEYQRTSLPLMTARITFGARVRAAREREQGWTQEELGKRVDVRGNYIAQIERDERAPSELLITRLANVLGKKREDLGQPEAAAGEDAAKYPARRPLLRDEEFKKAPEEVRQRVLGWPDAGEDWTTRQWYELFSESMRLHEKDEVDPRKDTSTKPARARKQVEAPVEESTTRRKAISPSESAPKPATRRRG